MCYPCPSTNGHANQTYADWWPEAGLPYLIGSEFSELSDPVNPNSFLDDESNPSLNLLSIVLFPVVASDVVAAIKFAEAKNVEISVKNSGHSYLPRRITEEEYSPLEHELLHTTFPFWDC